MDQVRARLELARDVSFLKIRALQAVGSVADQLRSQPSAEKGVQETIISECRRRAEQLRRLGCVPDVERTRPLVAPMLLEYVRSTTNADPWTNSAVLLAADPIVDDVLRATALEGDLAPCADSVAVRQVVLSQMERLLPPGVAAAEFADSYHRVLVVTGQWIEQRADHFVALETTWLEVISQTWTRPAVDYGTAGFVHDALQAAKRRACPFVALSACPLAYARRQRRDTSGRAWLSDLCRRPIADGPRTPATA